MSRKALLIGIVLVVVSVAAGFAGGMAVAKEDTKTEKKESAQDENPGRLFVLEGTATLTQEQLSVAVANARAAWFDDRPARNAGRIQVAGLVDAWVSYGFSSDPPNAELATESGSYPVELREPQWDSATSAVSFRVRPLDDVELPSGVLGVVHLFVDDAEIDCPGEYIVGDDLATDISQDASSGGLPGCSQIVAAITQSAKNDDFSTLRIEGQNLMCTGPEFPFNPQVICEGWHGWSVTYSIGQ